MYSVLVTRIYNKYTNVHTNVTYLEKVYDDIWLLVKKKNKKRRNNVVKMRVKFVKSDYKA